MKNVKAIQATYYSRAVMQMTSQQLSLAGYEVKERPIFNNFGGTELTVVVPSGRGKTKHIETIEKILGRGINIWLNNKKYNEQFS